MDNNFVVTIPRELKNIKSKLVFGLTKRQLIGFGTGLVLGVLVFLMLKGISLDFAMFGMFFVAAPIFFMTIYNKDGLTAEKWLRLWLEYNYLFPTKRYFKVSKSNLDVANIRKTRSVRKKNVKGKAVKSAQHIPSDSNVNERQEKTQS